MKSKVSSQNCGSGIHDARTPVGLSWIVEKLILSHVQELMQEGLIMKGSETKLPKPILLKAVVVSTLSLNSEPLIIVDRVVGIAVRVPISDVTVLRIWR